jgi:lipoprotein-anchoring transpeptidase ErfK/SrfK
MSRHCRELLGRELLAVGALAVGLTTVAIADRASAQYYCDERFQDCYRRPPPPPLPFPFGLFQPREAAPPPPQPEPRQLPLRPDNMERPVDPALARQYAALYAPANGEPFAVPGVRLSDIDPQYLRKRVNVQTDEAPGTIIINAQNRFLYFVEGGGRAVRYGVGVGRQGFGWSGVAAVKNKQEWPDWYPPKEMIARQTELRRQLSELQSGLGMPGGPRNPLGARAMYLWQGNKDTLYRIHGTFEPWTIGQNVSSGCIRMINQDVIDLYERVPLGAKVVVLPARS